MEQLSRWHKATYKYPGPKATITETLLIDAVSYGDVEAILAQILPPRIKTWDQTVNQRVEFAEVCFNNSKLPFYRVKVQWEPEGEDEKGEQNTYLIPAESPKDAHERMDDWLNDSMRSYTILDADTTRYLAVWQKSNEIWQGDCRNRFDELSEIGKHQRDNDAPTDYPDGKKKKEKPGPPSIGINFGDTDAQPGEKTDNSFGFENPSAGFSFKSDDKLVDNSSSLYPRPENTRDEWDEEDQQRIDAMLAEENNAGTDE